MWVAVVAVAVLLAGAAWWAQRQRKMDEIAGAVRKAVLAAEAVEFERPAGGCTTKDATGYQEWEHRRIEAEAGAAMAADTFGPLHQVTMSARDGLMNAGGVVHAKKMKCLYQYGELLDAVR
jgi:hypothetical protein